MTTNLSNDPHPLVDETKIQLYEQSYKRKLTPLQATIIDIWNNTIKAAKFLWMYPEIPKKKFDNAVSKYAKYDEGELILGLQDSSAFGSGKAGLILTTEGIYSIHLVIKYSEIDPDFVSFKFKSPTDQQLILGNDRNIPLINFFDSDTLSMLATFIKNAATITPSSLPDERWEFIENITDPPESIIQYYYKEDIKKDIHALKIKPSFYYRKYNKKLIKKDSDKGEWMPMDDPFYKEFKLSKEEFIKNEKKNNQILTTLYIAAPIIFIGAIVLLVTDNQNPTKDIDSGEWGALFWSALGSIVGTSIVFRINKFFGILTLIGSILYILRLYNSF